jgi:predicted dehydrogenase
MIKAAMIGLGWWGKHSIDCVQEKSKKISFVAAMSRNTDQHSDYLNEKNITAMNSYEDVINNNSIDAVVLTTPHSLHTDQIIQAAEKGKHVFVEKPITLVKSDAIRCIESLKKNNLKLGVGFSRRFQPAYLDLLSIINDGKIGEILHIEGEQSGPSAYKLKEGMWRANREESPGGAMAARGIHVLDAMISIAGNVKSISGMSNRRIVDVDVDDTTSMMMKFENGISGYLGSIYVTADIWRLHVYGSKGYVLMDGESKLILKGLDNKEKVTSYPDTNIVGLALESFADSISLDQDFPVSMEQAVSGIAAYEAMVKSANNESIWTDVDNS